MMHKIFNLNTNEKSLKISYAMQMIANPENHETLQVLYVFEALEARKALEASEALEAFDAYLEACIEARKLNEAGKAFNFEFSPDW